MLKIIKYLSYNKNKSKKNYIKCTKFKVLTNFMTNFYLLGIEKVLNFIQIPKGQTGGQRDRDSQVMVMEKDRDSFQKVRQEVRETAIPRSWSWRKTAIRFLQQDVLPK